MLSTEDSWICKFYLNIYLLSSAVEQVDEPNELKLPYELPIDVTGDARSFRSLFFSPHACLFILGEPTVGDTIPLSTLSDSLSVLFLLSITPFWVQCLGEFDTLGLITVSFTTLFVLCFVLGELLVHFGLPFSEVITDS